MSFSQVVAGLNGFATGRTLQVFALESNQIWTCSQTASGWSNWTLVASPSGVSGIAQLAVTRNGSLNLYARDSSGNIWSTAVTVTNGAASVSWSQVNSFSNATSIAASTTGMTSSSVAQIFAAGTNTSTSPSTSGTFTLQSSAWTSLSSTAYSSLAAALNESNGPLACFGISSGGVYGLQQSSGGGSWGTGGLQAVGTTSGMTGLAAAPLSDRRLLLAAITAAGAISMCWQSSAQSTTYASWSTSNAPANGSVQFTQVALANTASNMIQVFAIDDQGCIWTCQQNQPSTASGYTPSWGSWSQLQGMVSITATVSYGSVWSYSSADPGVTLSTCRVDGSNEAASIELPFYSADIRLSLTSLPSGSTVSFDSSRPFLWPFGKPERITHTAISSTTMLIQADGYGGSTTRNYRFRINANYTGPVASTDPTIVNKEITPPGS